jgi:hypothetical protein
MKRKFMTKAAFVSLLLCAATIAWWVRSANCMTQVTLQQSGKTLFRLVGDGGKMMFARTVQDSASPGAAGGSLAWAATPYASTAHARGSPALAWTSFSFTAQPLADAPGMESTLILPAWVPVTVFALLPAMWVLSIFKGKKKKAGH